MKSKRGREGERVREENKNSKVAKCDGEKFFQRIQGTEFSRPDGSG